MATPGQPPPLPSKDELIAIFRQGADAWNKWRENVPADEKLDLTGADLHDADVSRSTAQRSGPGELRIVDIPAGADLHNIDFRKANLQDVKFGESNLGNSDLREADLKGADLSGIKGSFLPSQLAGADLTSARLPEPLAKLYANLGSVSDISDSAKKLFLALLAACLYSWLTIATTKDVDLITNRASSPLPIIQTAIPIAGFYIVAPIILVCIYFYFHFYLQKLWEELAQLPAIFSDGKPLHQRVDPWLFNDLVRAHFSRLKTNRPFLSYFQQWISVPLAWGLVPITLFLFWARYLPRHDLIWTTVLALMLAVSIASAFQLYRLARETLEGGERTPFKWTKLLKRGRTYWDLSRALATTALLILISLGAIFGNDPTESHMPRGPRTWVARAMGWVRYSPFPNLDDADVSVKPPNWTGKKNEELDQVKGANLSGRNLRYASAQRAFLVKADLAASALENANLQYADLRQAIFTHSPHRKEGMVAEEPPPQAPANLQNVDLTNAKLSAADLRFANMVHSKLLFADLSGAHLESADLTDADLAGAQLNHARLGSAKLHSADLLEAHMTRASLVGADLASANLNQAELMDANLAGADLKGANLSITNLEGANLSRADLTDATLEGVGPKLKYADLRDARGVNPEFIILCDDWKLAFYDDDILKQLRLPADHNKTLEKQQKAEKKQQKNAVAPETNPKQP